MTLVKRVALMWLVVVYRVQHLAKALWKPVHDYRMMKSINRLLKESAK
jgi:hypothetical protein